MGAKLSIMDLTIDQAAEIEQLTGEPIDTWGDGPKVKLFRTILQVHEGRPAEDYAGMSLRDLLDRVTFTETEGEAEGERA